MLFIDFRQKAMTSIDIKQAKQGLFHVSVKRMQAASIKTMRTNLTFWQSDCFYKLLYGVELERRQA